MSKKIILTMCIAIAFVTSIGFFINQNNDKPDKNSESDSQFANTNPENNNLTQDNQFDDNSKGGRIVENNKPQKRQELEPVSKKAKNKLQTFPLESSLQLISITNGNANFKFESKNVGQETLTIQFPTSQRYEYEVINNTDGSIKRFSDGKSFLQVIHEEILEANQSLSYDINLANLTSGDYTLSMWLTFVGGIQTKSVINFSIE
ncbi:hypothetical protein DZB84_10440 [Bacillus sp. HNG]|uniref:BsuPI-related putative proteinase inhibitor n=1 Tax=Bacillus sp. HNG TaxID=2293325 RepID=UPI000E2EAA24|nr:BsuPI-related putative proteinase inhibitor [Bacillus sp. HNG]RFB17471.1 hypothetical protein DZB84_10440 [Bacillus sp. HNG]